MKKEQYYQLRFDGVTCSGCVASIEQKVSDISTLDLLQISDSDGSVVCSTEMTDNGFLSSLSSFQGCCDNCRIELNSTEKLSAEQIQNLDFNDDDSGQLIKEQYRVALQRALDQEEVACSEHCVCKTTDVDRIDEFEDAPSFASVYNLSELLQDYLEPDYYVIDFGCGTGHDVFRLAPLLSNGSVHGVDITPEMIDHAKTISKKMGIENVQFTVGSDLSSVSDESADAIYTNNVFNILEEKIKFIQSCFNKLKVGGRLIIADEFAIDRLPEKIKYDPKYRCGGIAGAQTFDDVISMMEMKGFSKEQIIQIRTYDIEYDDTTYQMETAIIIVQK